VCAPGLSLELASRTGETNQSASPKDTGHWFRSRSRSRTPGDEPLQYGPLIARSPVPSYRSHRPAELALPISAGSPGEGLSVVAILNPRGAPGPSIFGQAPILPHSSITGWISFVMSLSESELVGLPRSDLILSLVDENPNYVGIIRLGKNAATDIVPASGV
jgi:hypothetical protein